MHGALSLEEVLLLIFEHLDDRSLGRTARVCRRFFEPAIKWLWETIPGLRPLVLLFPEPIMRYTFGKLSFSRLPRDIEWQRYFVYARHVKAVRCSSEYTELPEKIHPELFELLSISRPVVNIVPNLIRLYWPYPTRVGLSFLFLSSSLRELTFYHRMDAEYDAFEAFCLAVASRSPHLQVLNICSKGVMSIESAPRQRASVVDLVRNLESLTRFGTDVFPIVSHDLITHLASRTMLRELEINLSSIPGPPPLPLIRIAPQPPSFPALRECHIRAGNVPVLSWILELLQSSELTGLTIDLISPNLPAVSQTIPFFSMFNQPRFSLLRALALELGSHVRQDNPPIFTIDHIRPLLSLHNLELIFIHVVLRLSDDDLRTIAPAWPIVTELHLGKRTYWINPGDIITPLPMVCRPNCSMLGLAAFAYHCPRLTSLSIEFNHPSTFQFWQTCGTNGAASLSPLTQLNVGGSGIDTPQEPCAILSFLFPRLTKVDHQSLPDEQAKMWNTVSDWLPILHRKGVQAQRAMQELPS